MNSNDKPPLPSERDLRNYADIADYAGVDGKDADEEVLEKIEEVEQKIALNSPKAATTFLLIALGIAGVGAALMGPEIRNWCIKLFADKEPAPTAVIYQQVNPKAHDLIVDTAMVAELEKVKSDLSLLRERHFALLSLLNKAEIGFELNVTTRGETNGPAWKRIR